MPEKYLAETHSGGGVGGSGGGGGGGGREAGSVMHTYHQLLNKVLKKKPIY